MNVGFFNKTAHKLINFLGYDLRRLTTGSNKSLQLIKAFNRFKVDTVIDVGANKGQFASELRSFGYKDRIISFEPLSSAYAELKKNSLRDSLWTIHTRCAIGDFDGEIKINISGNSVSSSLLPMLDTHSSAAIGSAYVNSEDASIFKLDTIAPPYIKESRNTFLKIDTQGYEWQVLDGALDVLPNVCGVLCELSLIPLYEGQSLWLDIIQRLENDGFTLWALQNGFTDPRDGRSLQVDAIFFRKIGRN